MSRNAVSCGYSAGLARLEDVSLTSKLHHPDGVHFDSSRKQDLIIGKEFQKKGSLLEWRRGQVISWLIITGEMSQLIDIVCISLAKMSGPEPCHQQSFETAFHDFQSMPQLNRSLREGSDYNFHHLQRSET